MVATALQARYLIRFDDICPTMNWSVWREIEAILVESEVKPMLAVVPNNQDDALRVSPERSDFWTHVRSWQRRGWTIGLHGYEHRYVNSCAGLVGLNRRSEFAGLSHRNQQEKLRLAVKIFEREHVKPDVWIAPSHSFDSNTIEALLDIGLPYISDGFFLYPGKDARGVMWIPQQIWRFRKVPFGVWTVCLHHNNWGLAELQSFSRNVAAYRDRITSFYTVVGEFQCRRLGFIDGLISHLFLLAQRLKRCTLKNKSIRSGTNSL